MTFIPSWHAVERQAKARIEELRAALETTPVDKLTSLQAEVRVWRQVLDLPIDLDPSSNLEPDTSGY